MYKNSPIIHEKGVRDKQPYHKIVGEKYVISQDLILFKRTGFQGKMLTSQYDGSVWQLHLDVGTQDR